MSRFVAHLVDAWGEYWSGGDPRGAGLIYRSDVRFWNVARGRAGEVLGVDAVAGERFAHLARSDRVGVVPGATVVDDGTVVLEFAVTGTECAAPSAAPGCTWWWVDDDGRIAREEWWIDVAAAVPATPEVWGDPLRGDAVDPGAEHRRRLVDRLAADADAAAGTRTTVHAVMGSGPFVAWTTLTVVDGPGRAGTWPEARLAVLDHAGRIAAEHRYPLRPWSAPRPTR